MGMTLLLWAPNESLELYEKGLTANIDCKFKRKIGAEKHDLKEMRVLNRILRITEDGLMYEADPRHVELLAKSMGLESCNTVLTPGLKRPFKDEVMDLVLDEDAVITAPLVRGKSKATKLKVTFNERVEIRNVLGYSSQYASHPRKFMIGRNLSIFPISNDHDPFTGISRARMEFRRCEMAPDQHARRAILRKVLREGAAWETPIATLIYTVSDKYVNKKDWGKSRQVGRAFRESGPRTKC